MGILKTRVIHPASRRGYSITRQGAFEALDGMLPTTDGRVALPVADLFQPDEL